MKGVWYIFIIMPTRKQNAVDYEKGKFLAVFGSLGQTM